MKNAGRFFVKKILSPPAAAAMISVVVMTMVLMVHPLIGMADNGDFYRAINGHGIYKLDRYEEDQFFHYFSSKFGLLEYYNDNEASLFSSHNLYIKAAVFLNGLFSANQTIFDIRFLSVFLLAELAVGIAMLVDYISFQKSWFQGMLLGALAVIMFADTAYTAYFNSFYGEGLVYVSTLILIVSALLMTQRRYPPLPLFLSVLVNSIILIFSKQQSATEGVPLFFLFAGMVFLIPKEQSILRKFVAGGAVLVAACGIIMYVIIPETFVYVNQYHAMTRGALMVGENPEEVLEEFGIDKQYSVLDGTIYFERYPAADVEGQQFTERFYGKYGFVPVTAYYVTHPAELIAMLDKAAANGYMIRPAAQGNYEREEGRAPGEQTQFFTLYSNLKKQYVPNTIGFVFLWLLIVLGVSFRRREKTWILLCAIVMGVIQIGTSIIGAGDADLAKHIFMYNVSFDLVSYICFAPIATRIVMHFANGLWGFVKKRRKLVAGAMLVLIPLSVFFLPAQAAKEMPEEKLPIHMLVIGKNGEDLSVEIGLAQAYGMQVTVLAEGYYTREHLKGMDYVITTTAEPYQDILSAGIPAICMGSAFTQVPESKLEKCRNKEVRFLYEGYEEESTFPDEFYAMISTTGQKSGTLLIEKGEKETRVPFAVQAKDGNFYIPVYDNSNPIFKILLGEVIKKQTAISEKGKTYFILDEVYVFSDLNKLCNWADQLNENGIPFLVGIMPLYDNLEYPAFLRFTQALRYMQSRGGTIWIHEPFVKEGEVEKEPLADKMLRFHEALTKEAVYFRSMENIPYPFTMEELKQITSEKKYFGNLPFDIMFGVTPELSGEEFALYLEEVNQKWLSFTDLQKEFGDPGELYEEREIPKDYVYREKEEAAFALFFSASDRFLLVVVSGSVILLSIFLLIGRKWYRRKFFEKR